MPLTITLTNEEYNFCKNFVDFQNKLLTADNISLGYTTYRDKRQDNNLIGFISEFAFHKFLVSNNIPFIANCFALISNANSNLLPPLADFITTNGLTIDVKSDRYDIEKLGAIVPNEKLIDVHLADLTFWLECNENNLLQVKLHGWNNRLDLINLRNQPNATRPNGQPMPKPCKRLLSNQINDLDIFIQGMKSLSKDGLYQIIASKVS